MRRLRATPLLGCAAILVDFIGLGMVAPILPGIVSSEAIGAILTAQYLAVVVGQVAVGALADRYGRRRMIIFVMVFDSLLFASTGFTKDVKALVVLRLLAGLAAPVALGISYVAALSADLPPARAQFNFALVGVSFNLGSLVGAATGGMLGPDMWLPANLGAGAVPALVAVWALASEDVGEQRRLAATHVSAGQTSATATVDGAKSSCITSPPNTRIGVRAVLVAPEFAALLLAYVAQGIFQGGFFSLMPVLLAAHTTASNASAVADDSAGGASDTSARVIAATIIAAAVLQIFSNLVLVRRTLRRWGAHGHTALMTALGALMLSATAVLVDAGSGGGDDADASPLFVGALCGIYSLAYVPSATSLTALNMLATKYALRYGAPVGTITGIGRSVFSSAFGVAPVSTIALYGAAPWAPIACMAVLSAGASLAFGRMVVLGWPDPVAPVLRPVQLASAAPPDEGGGLRTRSASTV